MSAETFDLEDDEQKRNLQREACQTALRVIVPAAAHIASAKSFNIGLAQILFAFDLEPRSMRDIASELGVTVACISKGAKEFVAENNLPTPKCMKSPEASRVYREVRNSQLKPTIHP